LVGSSSSSLLLSSLSSDFYSSSSSSSFKSFLIYSKSPKSKKNLSIPTPLSIDLNKIDPLVIVACLSISGVNIDSTFPVSLSLLKIFNLLVVAVIKN